MSDQPTPTLTAEQVQDLRTTGSRGSKRAFRDELRSVICKLCDSHEALRQSLVALRTELEKAQREIALAREACPSVRMQDHFNDPLLVLVEREVSRCFRMQSCAEAAEAQRTEAEQALAGLKAWRWWSSLASLCIRRGN